MSETQSIQINDTPLVSMVLVDDNNNRTTFNGPIINDFTITEDLQEKITQLTTLTTNIGNLQTRLTNITNILNTQNIEFTNTQPTNVSDAGSKLYIQPQIGLKLYWIDSDGTELGSNFINLTRILTGKVSYPTNQSYTINTYKGYVNHCKLCLVDTSTVPTPNLGTEETLTFIHISSGTNMQNDLYGSSTWNTGVSFAASNSPTFFDITCEDSAGQQYRCRFNLSGSME